MMLRGLVGRTPADAPPDAVRVPLRLQLACVASLWVCLLLCNTTIRFGIGLNARIARASTQYVAPLAEAVAAVRTNVANATGGTLHTDELARAVARAARHLESMGDAVEAGATCGATAQAVHACTLH
jgi:hypothetical protein